MIKVAKTDHAYIVLHNDVIIYSHTDSLCAEAFRCGMGTQLPVTVARVNGGFFQIGKERYTCMELTAFWAGFLYACEARRWEVACRAY